MTITANIPKDAPTSASPMDRLQSLVSLDLVEVEAILESRAASPVETIPDLSGYIVSAGGKRLRPLITLASALAAAPDKGPRTPQAAHFLAAAVEFIHTATLLHDDVVDDSDLRRGRKAARNVWGNPASILVGDFLFARAFTLMVDTKDLQILDILSNASCVIVEGEVQQLAALGKANLPMEDYMTIVEAKTAALFEAAARAGALTNTQDADIASALGEYGRRLGRAFQLVDDALDYDGATQALGKAVGDDFREGKLTMPVLIARDQGEPSDRAFWDRVMDVNQQTDADLDGAIERIRATSAIEATLDAARREADEAKRQLGKLPQSAWADALADVADFCVDRAF